MSAGALEIPASPSLLIIDDEAVVRMLLEDFFTEQGFTVRLADCGLAGLEAFSRHPVDLVLVDYGLPDLNGIEVCRRLKAIRPAVPLLLITGWGSFEAAEQEPDIARVVSKPFDLLKLLTLIRELSPPLAGP